MQKQYTRLYARLSMQAQHKYFSGTTLSGRGAGLSISRRLKSLQGCCKSDLHAHHACILGLLIRVCSAEALYEHTLNTNGVTIAASAEDPFLRFAKTQRLSESLAP